MVLRDEVSSATIAECRRMLRRADDVGEEDRCQDAVERGFLLANRCQKSPNLVDDRLRARIPVEMRSSLARVLDDAGAGALPATKCPPAGETS